jgi:microcystin-dependent protein
MDYYMSQILIMSNTFVPYGFVSANGASMTVAQYNALYALLGVTFGGSAGTTFMVPDLCGRVPMGMGLSQRDRIYNYTEGEYGGVTTTTITSNQLTAHSHIATFTPIGTIPTPVTVTVGVNSDAASTTTVANPKNNVIAKGVDNSNNPLKNFSTAGATAGSLLGGVTVSGGGGLTGGTVENSVAGLSQPFSLMQPYVVINYVLCISGIFPVRQ